jgi:hypothetical protein
MSATGATEIIYRRLVGDENSTQELQCLLQGCSSLASKAIMIERYCQGSLSRCLRDHLQVQVVPNLMAGVSWTELASRVDATLAQRAARYM